MMRAATLVYLVAAAEPVETAAADAAAASYQPKEGTCGTYPAVDEACNAASRGSFDAKAKDITSLQLCAQYAKEQCNSAAEKAVYVSFQPGEVGYHEATGQCSWFGLDQCACYDGATCQGMPTENQPADGWQNKIHSGLIAKILHEGGSGIAVERGTGDNAEVEDTIEDPAYAEQQQAMMNAEATAPEAAQLSIIPTAEELNLESMHSDPNLIAQVLEDAGATEPSCPDQQTAVRRGEWQCITNEGGLRTGALAGFMLGSVLTGMLAAGAMHKRGMKLRSKNVKDDGDAGDAGADEDDA